MSMGEKEVAAPGPVVTSVMSEATQDLYLAAKVLTMPVLNEVESKAVADIRLKAWEIVEHALDGIRKMRKEEDEHK